jgi:hypothetical protein
VLRRIASAVIAGVALLAAFGCGASGDRASIDSGTARERAVTPAADPSTDASTTTTSTAAASSTTSTSTPMTVAPAPTTATAADGLRTVTYRGVQFDVPADWPVYDLAANPSTCVRFDVHAVYLGQPGADMKCPAGLIGRADAVLVEPTGGQPHAGSQASGNSADVAATTASGLSVQVATNSAVASEVAADIPTAGVSVTLTYRDSDATAQQILRSFRAAS